MPDAAASSDGPRVVKPTIPQTKYLASVAPIVALVGGVGSGKTWAGIMKARTKIMKGLSGAIVAPDFPHFARSTWDVMEKWLPWSYCTNRALNHPYTKEQVLRFNYNGLESKVWYGAMENVEAWTGMNLSWFFFDECRREKTQKAFNVLVSRLRVGAHPQGFLASSPLGASHWMYDVCVKEAFPQEVIDVFRKNGYNGRIVEYFHTKTKDNEENLSPTYYALMQGLYSGKLAKQELEGEFIALEGAVWEGFSDKVDEGNVTELADYNDSVDVEWWVDDGFVHKHPRVVLFAQVIPPYINIFDEYIIEGEYPETTIAKCLKYPSEERPYRKASIVLIDSTAAELRSKLWDADFDTVKSSHEVEQGILHVGPFILDGKGKRRLRVHPRCTRTVQGILGYTRDDDTQKLAKLGDDVADALRYGLWNKSVEELDADAMVAPLRPEERVIFVLPNGHKVTQAEMDANRRAATMEEMLLQRWNTQYLQQ